MVSLFWGGPVGACACGVSAGRPGLSQAYIPLESAPVLGALNWWWGCGVSGFSWLSGPVCVSP